MANCAKEIGCKRISGNIFYKSCWYRFLTFFSQNVEWKRWGRVKDKFYRFSRFTTHVSLLIIIITITITVFSNIVCILILGIFICCLVYAKIEVSLFPPLAQIYVSVCLSKQNVFPIISDTFGGDLLIQMVHRNFCITNLCTLYTRTKI